VRERFDCTVLTLSDNVVESLWVRIRGMKNQGDIVGVCSARTSAVMSYSIGN